MNQLLQGSLAEYGFTGDKVNRLIAGAKTFEIWWLLLSIVKKFKLSNK